MNLKGKVIAVTGGGRGIGLATAVNLAKRGAEIAILELDQEVLSSATALVEAEGVKAMGYICDVANEEQVTDTFNKIVQDFGAIEGLVNNAGILRDAQLIKVKDGKVVKKMSAEHFDLVVDVHMKGAFLCAREASAHMVELGVEEGCIVSMSSIAYRGNFGQSNYSAAKAGIIAMSRVWARELGPYNIRSMAIAPGSIETELLRTMPAEILDGFVKQIPVRRIGAPENIAQAVVSIFENDYLSGDVMEVHGGFVI